MSEPATKADVKEAVQEAVQQLMFLIRDVGADVASLRTDVTTLRGDMAELRAGVNADMAELRAGVNADMAQLRADVEIDIARHVNAAKEETLARLDVILEASDAARVAAETRDAALRAEFEAHRDDAALHRAPRRRAR